MKSSVQLKVGNWYILESKMSPDDRSRDRKVVITALNPKMVYFDQKTDRRCGIQLKMVKTK